MFVVRELPRFNCKRDGSFRRWLGNVVANRLRTNLKKCKRRPLVGLDGASGDAFVEQLADKKSILSEEWDRQQDKFVLDRLMATSRTDFTMNNWEAFCRCTFNDEAAAMVAADLRISVNAVLTAKSHVLRHLF